MNQMKLNISFIKNIHATYGQEGEIWLSHLSDHLERLSVQWNFQMICPVKDISYNFVAVVKLQSGLAILKTAPPSARLMAEAEWLNAHKKSVPVIFHMDKENNAYLMEKLEPGTSLKYLVKEGNDEKATRIISQVILDLQSTDTLHQMNYQPISEHVSSFAFLRGHIDTNIIDRDGYIGDPCAEVGPMIFNPLDCFPQHLSMQNIIETRLNILAEMLPFDLERIKAWAFCLALRSAAWDIEGFGNPNDHTIKIAKILYDIL